MIIADLKNYNINFLTGNFCQSRHQAVKSLQRKRCLDIKNATHHEISSRKYSSTNFSDAASHHCFKCTIKIFLHLRPYFLKQYDLFWLS